MVTEKAIIEVVEEGGEFQKVLQDVSEMVNGYNSSMRKLHRPEIYKWLVYHPIYKYGTSANFWLVGLTTEGVVYNYFLWDYTMKRRHTRYSREATAILMERHFEDMLKETINALS